MLSNKLSPINSSFRSVVTTEVQRVCSPGVESVDGPSSRPSWRARGVLPAAGAAAEAARLAHSTVATTTSPSVGQSPSPSPASPTTTWPPPPLPTSDPPGRPDHVRVATAMTAVRHLARRGRTAPPGPPRRTAGPPPGSSAVSRRSAGRCEQAVPHAGGRLLGCPGAAGRSVTRRHPWRRPPGRPWLASARTSTRCRRRPAPRTTRPGSACSSRWRGGARAPHPAAGGPGRVRLGGAPRSGRRRPPLRVPGVRRRCRRPERTALRGMVSLDRVGVGSSFRWQRERSGRDAAPLLLRPGGPASDRGDDGNRASDHWSFVRARDCRGRGWGAPRTPATTRPATCRPSSSRPSSGVRPA